MKRTMLLAAVLAIASATAFGQSNEFVDRFLSADYVSVSQASYLVLVASDNLGEDADEARAFELLINFGWAPKGAVADQPIKVKEFAYLLMKAFGLRGGLMYSLFPCPHYAFRQMSASLVIQGRSDPDQLLSGYEAIRMLGRIFDVKGITQ